MSRSIFGHAIRYVGLLTDPSFGNIRHWTSEIFDFSCLLAGLGQLRLLCLLFQLAFNSFLHLLSFNFCTCSHSGTSGRVFVYEYLGSCTVIPRFKGRCSADNLSLQTGLVPW
jgi:hypothetical protein